MPSQVTQRAQVRRRFPIGAEVAPGGGVHFRVWAPCRDRVELVLENQPSSDGRTLEMRREQFGYYSLFVRQAAAGTLYRYLLEGEDQAFPDPASRYQPEGPFGPSQVVDPTAFAWTDQNWPGLQIDGRVIYEMHVGTFTPEGTFAAAAEQLAELASVGIDLLELMPVADWAGEFGWGYDGVDLFAPTRLYGTPDDCRRFVDRAHAVGIGVLLDVVYNHVGASGNYLAKYCPEYFTDRYKNEWGQAINFDGPDSAPVREFFLTNARYWIEEFHLDGYRIDATQAFFDASSKHILGEITAAARAAAGTRPMVIIAESEPQNVRMLTPPQEDGFGMDAAWNDDFHHSAMVRLTGRREAYYTDYLGLAQEFVAAAKWGYLYQGQLYKWQGKPRGTPVFGFPAKCFINYLQNHDQIANTGLGLRVHESTSASLYRAMTAVLLLGPWTPLLFQGQEFAASTPFCYFLDSPPELAPQVAQGRAKFLAQFPSLAVGHMQRRLPPPADRNTFEKCKLDFSDREKHQAVYQLHKDLLTLRRADEAISQQRVDRLDGAVLNDDSFVIRFFSSGGQDRLLMVNFGCDLHYFPAPQPLLARVAGRNWTVLWTSEDPLYGGMGTPPVDTQEGWHIPGHTALVLSPS